MLHNLFKLILILNIESNLNIFIYLIQHIIQFNYFLIVIMYATILIHCKYFTYLFYC